MHLCVYLLFMPVCEQMPYVHGKQGMKEAMRNRMVRVHTRVVFPFLLCIQSKKVIPLLDLFFLMYKKQLGPHLAPHVLKQKQASYESMPYITTLSFSPWICIFLRNSNKWQRAGNMKRATAHWAGSILKVREESNLRRLPIWIPKPVRKVAEGKVKK